jgi:hypothetical protein
MLRQEIDGMYFKVFAMVELCEYIELCRNCMCQSTDHIELGDLTKNERIIDPGLRPYKQVNSNQEGK